MATTITDQALQEVLSVVQQHAMEAGWNTAPQWLPEPTPMIMDAFLAMPTPKQPKIATQDASKPASEMRMQDLYSYPSLRLNKNHNTSFERKNPLVGHEFEWTTTQGMVGIEVEVENITQVVPLQAFWESKSDGSLRNNGVEFVSHPLQVKHIQHAIEHLYTALHLNNKPDFSNRTSIHIHVNCRDMTQDEVYNFVLLYAIFEKHFYSVAGTKRMNSIFCVPLFRTNELNRASQLIYEFQPYWHKYCGLNLLPLVDNNGQRGYGTIEFRHLFGTTDTQKIYNWINDILCLRKYAMSVKKADLLEEIKRMNTSSSYMSLYSQVFEKGQRILCRKLDFEECISNIKRELFGNEFSKTLKLDLDSQYWTMCRTLGMKG